MLRIKPESENKISQLLSMAASSAKHLTGGEPAALIVDTSTPNETGPGFVERRPRLFASPTKLILFPDSQPLAGASAIVKGSLNSSVQSALLQARTLNADAGVQVKAVEG